MVKQSNVIARLIYFVYLRKKFILFSTVKLAVVGLGLVTNIFIARKFSVYGFGVYNLAIMLVGLAASLAFNWSSSALLYYGSKERSATGTLNKTFWSRNIILFFSIAAVTFVFIIFRKSINAYVENDIAYLILGWIYIRVVEDYLSNYFLTIGKQELAMYMDFTARFIFLLLVLIFTFDVRTLLVLNILSDATVIFYLIKINRKDFGQYQFDRTVFTEVLSFSLWQFFGFASLYLINFGDNIVIKHFMTIEDVGLYNAAYKIFNGISSLSYIIASFYGASVAIAVEERNFRHLKGFFYSERWFILTLVLLLHLLILLFSKQIIILLYGKVYEQAVTLLRILLPGSLLRYAAVFQMIYFNSAKQYKIQQSLNVLRAVLNILFDLLLIKNLGLLGPALGTTLAVIITLTASTIYSEKKIKAVCSGNISSGG